MVFLFLRWVKMLLKALNPTADMDDQSFNSNTIGKRVVQTGSLSVTSTAYAGSTVVDRTSFEHGQEKAPFIHALAKVNDSEWIDHNEFLLDSANVSTSCRVTADETNIYINIEHGFSPAPTFEIKYYAFWRDDG